jgi:putative nucleotidyltransferase with HDIG domain
VIVKGVQDPFAASATLHAVGRRPRASLLGPLTSERRLLAALRWHHPYTEQHSRRVAQLSVAVGRTLKMASSDLLQLRQVAIMHDVGKTAVPPRLLDGSTPLTADERKVIEHHSEAGDALLRDAAFPENISSAVRAVHERQDGTGYPDGLSGDNIPLFARIVAVCDALDAMSAPGRNYQRAMTAGDALRILQKSSGRHFDGDVVQALRRVIAGGHTTRHVAEPAPS